MVKAKIEMEEKKEEKAVGTGKLLVVIRISGMVKVRDKVSETLDRLKLRRKYSCVLIDGNDENLKGMLKKVKFYVAYGEISKETLEKLIKERGERVEGRKKKIEVKEKEVAEGLMKGKKLKDYKLKEFFRLHPPRKGIDSKLQYPKGVLGNNKDKINDLIGRML